MDLTIPEDDIREVLQMEGLDSPPEEPAMKDGRGGSKHYQKYIRDNDCLGCRSMNIMQEYPTQHHHALSQGTALRCPDEYGIPLCHKCHGMLHGMDRGGKRTFLQRTGISNYYAPVSLYLVNYCVNRTAPNFETRRAVYYFKTLYKWLQTKTAQTILENEPESTRSPTAV